jgi:hypothetical protein
MKNIIVSIADPGPVTVHASIASIAELYAAAAALEPADTAGLQGLGDLAAVSLIVPAGALRRLIAALGKCAELPEPIEGTLHV